MFMNSKKKKKKKYVSYFYTLLRKKIKSLFCPIEKRNKQMFKQIFINILLEHSHRKCGYKVQGHCFTLKVKYLMVV